MNVNGFNCFRLEEFNDTPVLRTRSHVRRHLVRLPPAAIWRTAIKLMGYWRQGSTSTAIPPTSASDVVDQHNKIGGVRFGAPLV